MTAAPVEVPASLVATFNLAWTGDPLPNGASLGLEPDPGAERHFELCMSASERFAFNPSFPLRRMRAEAGRFTPPPTRYLGHAFLPDAAGLGRCRCDVLETLLDREGGIPIRLLQVHLKPVRGEAKIDGEFITSMVKYSHRFLAVAEEAGNPVRGRDSTGNDPALETWKAVVGCLRTGPRRTEKRPRRHSLPLSYLLAYSLHDMPAAEFEQREKYAVPLYSLLYGHAAGVNPVVAKREAGPDQGWSSTAFLESWFQPGAIVMLSTAHPPNRTAEDMAHFAADFLDEGPPAAARAGLPREDRYQANDNLPEYPPLRYTPFWVAIYGLMYEEILRDTFDRLVELHGLSEGRVWPSLRRILRRGKETGILTQRLTRFDNLEHLRLPVTRPLAERIMKSKSQDQVARTIVEFRVGHSIIATGAMLIAMLGLFVALASLLVGIPSALQAIRGPDSAAPTDTAASR